MKCSTAVLCGLVMIAGVAFADIKPVEGERLSAEYRIAVNR